MASLSQFERLRVLGYGSFGCAVLLRAADDSLVVAKEVRRCPDTEQEIELLRRLRHRHIIGFVDVLDDASESLSILMEYADGGDLEAFLDARKRASEPLVETEVLRLFGQVMTALAYLHDLRVLHRDLKPSNILLVHTPQGLDVRLTDFGIAKAVADVAQSRVGTPCYMSPEVLRGQPYGPPSDCWSAGVVLYELSELERPFDAQSFPALAIKVINDEPRPPTAIPRAAAVCVQLLRKDPAERPTAADCIARLASPRRRRRNGTPAQDDAIKASSSWRTRRTQSSASPAACESADGFRREASAEGEARSELPDDARGAEDRQCSAPRLSRSRTRRTRRTQSSASPADFESADGFHREAGAEGEARSELPDDARGAEDRQCSAPRLSRSRTRRTRRTQSSASPADFESADGFHREAGAEGEARSELPDDARGAEDRQCSAPRLSRSRTRRTRRTHSSASPAECDSADGFRREASAEGEEARRELPYGGGAGEGLPDLPRSTALPALASCSPDSQRLPSVGRRDTLAADDVEPQSYRDPSPRGYPSPRGMPLRDLNGPPQRATREGPKRSKRREKPRDLPEVRPPKPPRHRRGRPADPVPCATAEPFPGRRWLDGEASAGSQSWYGGRLAPLDAPGQARFPPRGAR